MLSRKFLLYNRCLGSGLVLSRQQTASAGAAATAGSSILLNFKRPVRAVRTTWSCILRSHSRRHSLVAATVEATVAATVTATVAAAATATASDKNLHNYFADAASRGRVLISFLKRSFFDVSSMSYCRK